MATAWRIVADDYGSPYRHRPDGPPTQVTTIGAVIEYERPEPPSRPEVREGVWAWQADALAEAIRRLTHRPEHRLVEIAYDPADVVATPGDGALCLRRFSVLRELDELERLLELASRHATTNSRIHGIEHWRCVGEVGADLAAAIAGADARVVLVFAAFHDSQRLNDGRDPEHGQRAADVVHSLRLLHGSALETVTWALVEHDRGLTADDPTVGCCWDADRLDLVRLGMRIRPDLLSTGAGRELARERESAGAMRRVL
jgi:uncharacterized protein